MACIFWVEKGVGGLKKNYVLVILSFSSYQVHKPPTTLGNAEKARHRDENNANAHDIDADGECWRQCNPVAHRVWLLVLNLEDLDQ